MGRSRSRERVLAENIIVDLLEEERPMTVRQVYYSMLGRGVGDKTERYYRKVAEWLKDMRREGRIPWAWIEDRTRSVDRPHTWESPRDMLAECAEQFQVNRWANQGVRVAITLESEALAGIICPIASEYQVPILATRGHPSCSSSRELAIVAQTFGILPVYVYHFGDYDPSGLAVQRTIESHLRDFVDRSHGRCGLTVIRAGLTRDQFFEYDLPSNGPPKAKDNNASAFPDTFTAQLEAIPPRELRRLVREVCTRHIDHDLWAEAIEKESAMKDAIRSVTGSLDAA